MSRAAPPPPPLETGARAVEFGGSVNNDGELRPVVGEWRAARRLVDDDDSAHGLVSGERGFPLSDTDFMCSLPVRYDTKQDPDVHENKPFLSHRVAKIRAQKMTRSSEVRTGGKIRDSGIFNSV